MKATQPIELINTVVNPTGIPVNGFNRLWFRNFYLVHQDYNGTIRDVTLDRPLTGFQPEATAIEIVSTDTVLQSINKIQGALNNIELVGDVLGSGTYNAGKIQINVTGFGAGAGVDLQDTLDNDPIATIDVPTQITASDSGETSIWLVAPAGHSYSHSNGAVTSTLNITSGSVFLSKNEGTYLEMIELGADPGSLTIMSKEIGSAKPQANISFDPSDHASGGLILSFAPQGSAKQEIAMVPTGIRIDEDFSSSGLFYKNDYAVNGIANHGDRWIPDYGAIKAYCNANNYLGGNLTNTVGNLSHDGGFYDLTNLMFGNIFWQSIQGNLQTEHKITPNGFEFISENTALVQNSIDFQWDLDDGFTMLHKNAAGNYTGLKTNGVSGGGILVQDSQDTIGMVYHADYYSSNINNDLWIPNLAAVRTEIASASYNTGIVDTGVTWVDNGDGTITLPNVDVSLNSQANFTGLFKKFTVTGITTALTDNDTNYIYVDYNSGTPQWVVTTAQPDYNNGDIAKYLEVYRSGTTLNIIEWEFEGSGLSNKLLERDIETRKFEKAGGLNLSIGGTNALQVNISAGIVWNGIKRTTTSDIDSWADRFYSNFHSGGVWSSFYSNGGGVLNNTNYDNGTNLVALGSNKYVVNWIYKGVESAAHIYEVIGVSEYATVAAAQEELPPALPELISSHAILVGRVICRQGSTTAFVEQAIDIGFVSAAAANLHNELTNIQGGLANEYYHLSQAEHAVATQAASATLDGYLTSANWTAFNNKTDKASATLSTWTVDSGNVYFQDFTHNLGTEDIVVELHDATTKETVLPDAIVRLNANTVRIKVIGNSTNYRITVVG